MKSLEAEIENEVTERALLASERKQDERDRSKERMRQAIMYTFGQEPDSVHWDSKFGAVATVGDIRMALIHKSSTPSLSVVCVCNECGQAFLSFETFGSDKNHYGPKSERPVKQRRAEAVKRIAQVAERGYQPNKWGHDHKCVMWVTREIPMSLLAQVDTLLQSRM